MTLRVLLHIYSRDIIYSNGTIEQKNFNWEIEFTHSSMATAFLFTPKSLTQAKCAKSESDDNDPRE